MGFEHKIVKMVACLPKINKMIRTTFASNPEDFKIWEKQLVESIDNLVPHYNLETLKELIISHPYIANTIKKEKQSILTQLFQEADEIAKKEIFFSNYISQFENHHFVLLITNNDSDEYGVSHALYCDGLLNAFSNNEMTLKQLIWFTQCIREPSTVTTISSNEDLNNYITKNGKFPLWLKELNF